jgi:ferredoxin--NADP+ reductase
VVRNELDADGRAVATGEEEVIECGLVLRSIGYRGVALDGIPFDERRGLIRNNGGRVVDDSGAALRGEYTVGWIKRGPSGVIGTNKKCAADTVAAILDDAGAGALNAPARSDRDAIEPWLRQQAPGLVTWSGWQAIDAYERSRGEAAGRPRVKLVDVGEMVSVAACAPAV